MDIVSTRKLDWTELATGSVPCRECRTLLGKLRGDGHALTLHEDATGVVHMEIRPRVPKLFEKSIGRHKEHLIQTAIMISIPQIFRVLRGRRSVNGQWDWERVEERQTTYAAAAREWDEFLRTIGSWSDGQTAFRATWGAGGEVRRSANFPPWARQKA